MTRSCSSSATPARNIAAPAATTGLGGLIYLYTHVGVLWGDGALLTKATELLTHVAERITDDRSLDVIGGSAGCIPCLLSLHSQRPDTRALELAIACGDHVINTLRKPSNLHRAEATKLRYERGFSHGYAGLAWALAELGRETGEPRFINVATEFLAIERSLLCGERWTDPEDPLLEGQASWCHGAPGIALGRLAMLSHNPAADIRADTESALERASRSVEMDNHGLCHGLLGNLETLLVASEIFPDNPTWSELTKQRGRAILDDIATHGWRSSRPGHLDVPGLMTGIAGIGFELLRLAAPHNTPSVLLLQTPRSV